MCPRLTAAALCKRWDLPARRRRRNRGRVSCLLWCVSAYPPWPRGVERRSLAAAEGRLSCVANVGASGKPPGVTREGRRGLEDQGERLRPRLRGGHEVEGAVALSISCKRLVQRGPISLERNHLQMRATMLPLGILIPSRNPLFIKRDYTGLAKQFNRFALA